MRDWISRIWRELQPADDTRRGAAWGAVALLGVVTAVAAASQYGPGFGPLLDVPSGALVGLVIASLILLSIALGLRIVALLQRFLGLWGLAALGAFAVTVEAVLPFPGTGPAIIVGLGLALLAAAGGAAVVAARRGDLRYGTRGQQIAIAVTLATSGSVALLLLFWLIWAGSEAHLVEGPHEGVAVQPLAAPDPSEPGPFGVLTLHYGSGSDLHRAEFGAEADLLTEPVDATPFVKGNKGWRVGLRNSYWGFDFEAFPRNGRVWHPEGDGPFPLVLIVHGNHRMSDFSDTGYAYLGELLASRGFITVSVDENFLNGWWVRGLSKENDARAWMLLQHLVQWREWNQTEGNPFHGRVDLDAVGLIGHSRGGEAAAIAGAFNRLSYYPDDATVEFDFGFGIRAIIAIAPSDGQYRPTGRPTPLRDVSYLVLQGGHDSDVASFVGARQYERLELDPDGDGFKASLYAYRANHGQFNTVWGRTDYSWPRSVMLNTAPLLDGEDQRRLGKIYMVGFLEATLHGNASYVPLFRDHRRVAHWLPDDVYVTRFEDASFVALADFEEDLDLETTTLAGGAIQADGLAVWREENLSLRNSSWGRFENNAAVLGWRSEAEAASYALFLPQEGLEPLENQTLLVFSLAELDEKPPDEDDEDEEEEEEEPRPLDLIVELETSSGVVARLPLSHFRTLPPVLRSRFTKLWKEDDSYANDWEAVLQTFELPLGAFADAQPDFFPADLAVVRFVFDQSSRHVVALDRVGFAHGPG